MRFPCNPCQTNYDGWLNYGPPVTRWIQYMNPTRSVEAYKTKQQERRKLVGSQLDLIIGSCRGKGCIK
jgi:hypothetical protein